MHKPKKKRGAKGTGVAEIAAPATGAAERKPNPDDKNPGNVNQMSMLSGGIGLYKNCDDHYGPTMEVRQQMLNAAAELMHPPGP